MNVQWQTGDQWLSKHRKEGSQRGTRKRWGWRICSLSWLWWWFYRCTYVSKHQNLHFKYVQFVVCQVYLNKTLKKKKLEQFKITRLKVSTSFVYLFWFLTIEYCFIRAEIQFILLFLDLRCLKLGVPRTYCELLITPKFNGIKWPYAILMDSVHQELRQSENGLSLLHSAWGSNRIAGDRKCWVSL